MPLEKGIGYRREHDILIVTGDTFPHKNAIKALGARFNWETKNWWLPFTPEAERDVAAFCARTAQAPKKIDNDLVAQLEAAWDYVRPEPGDGAALLSAPSALGQSELAREWLTAEPDIPGPPAAAAAGRQQGIAVETLVDLAAMTLARAFAAPVWVIGEVQGLNWRGETAYFQLSSPKTGAATPGSTVEVSAVLWQSNARAIRTRHGKTILTDVLKDGLRLRCFCKVTLYRDRARLSLNVHDIDPVYTRGELALQREALLRELRAAGIDRLNKALPLPAFPLRVALITAEGSRAFSDFLDQLVSGAFPGEVIFVASAMQGESTTASVTAAIAAALSQSCDVIVITRGGGSAGDLRWFDSREIALAAAHCPIPIVAAIGHHEDVCILEEVAFRREKTPTAAADFILSVLAETTSRIDDAAGRMENLVANWLRRLVAIEAAFSERLAHAAATALDRAITRIDEMRRAMDQHALLRLLACESALETLGGKISAFDPMPWMAKGWTRLMGAKTKTLQSVRATSLGERLQAVLVDGALDLEVVGVRPSGAAKGKDKSKNKPERETSHRSTEA